MDLLLLGAMAVVLIALTVWLVWRPGPEDARPEAKSAMTPMGDEFEDQYTSATADLSAGGVAITTASSQEEEALTEQVSAPPTARPTGAPAEVPARPEPHDRTQPASRPQNAPRTVGMGAAAAMALGGVAAGAWLYARWQRERNKPINRLRRRFR